MKTQQVNRTSAGVIFNDKDDCRVVIPPNYGWIEKKLDQQAIDYFWRLIENKRGDYKEYLAGHIEASYILQDKKDWLLTNVLEPLVRIYHKTFGNDLAASFPCPSPHPLYIHDMWVNYQKKHDYNPIHHHHGIYSFVLWLKIPTRHKEQNNLKNVSGRVKKDSVHGLNSVFQFQYVDILGVSNTYNYHLNPEDEGKLLFFPSSLWHSVYPFYNCDETRISVSGNLGFNTWKKR